MTDYPNYKPEPGDWDLPDEIKESIDPIAYALLSERAIDGIPVGVTFVASREYAHVDLLFSEGASADEILQAIETTRKPFEERYPDAIQWDRIHSAFASKLLVRGDTDQAFSLLETIVSPYATISAFMKAIHNEDATVNLVSQGLTQFMESNDEKREDLLRAFRDYLVDDGDAPALVASIDEELIAAGIEKDPIHGWLESRQLDQPNKRWDTVQATANEYSFPEDMPISTQRHALTSFHDVLCFIGENKLHEQINDAIELFHMYEAAFSESDIWDNMRSFSAFMAFAHQQPEAAIQLALSIKNPAYMAELTHSLLEFGFEDEAVKTTFVNPNPEIVVDLITSTIWSDQDATFQLLVDYLRDTAHPVQRRKDIVLTIISALEKEDGADMTAGWRLLLDDIEGGTA